MIVVLGLTALVIAALIWRARAKRRWRQEVLASRLTDAEWRIVLDQVPLVRQMPSTLKAPLEGKIALFLNQVELVGCNGLEVSDEMALSIAAQASLLVVNTDAWYQN